MCVPTIPTGGACVPLQSFLNTNGGCAPTDFCYNATCTRLNALPDFATFASPADSQPLFASAASAGTLLCASGLAVPLPDPFGFTSPAGRCVPSLSLSQIGLPCSSCPSSGGSNYPVFGDGSLLCTPFSSSQAPPCTLYPSSLYTPAWAALQVATAACVTSARGPSGVPCALGSTAAGRCASFVCSDVLTQASVLSATQGHIWPQWWGPPSTPQCVSDIAAANGLWRGSLSRAALCNATLPAAFAALGWTCGAPASFSLTPSPSLTPSQSASPSVTPTAATATPSPSSPGCPPVGANCSTLTRATSSCLGTGSDTSYWPSFCNYTAVLPSYFLGGVCQPVPPSGIAGVRRRAGSTAP